MLTHAAAIKIESRFGTRPPSDGQQATDILVKYERLPNCCASCGWPDIFIPSMGMGRLGLYGFTSVDSDGLSEGLALYWYESLHVDVLDKSNRFIDA